MPAKKKKAKTAARKVQEKKSRKKAFPTDVECVELRRRSAEKEMAKVRRVEVDGYFGTFQVSSTQWPEPYTVEIRSLAEPINSCSCQDFQMNRLGTCKHILRVMHFLGKGKKHALASVANTISPYYEVFFDAREYPPALRLDAASRKSAVAERVLEPYFGADGRSLGEPGAAFDAVYRAVLGSSSTAQKKIRITQLGEDGIRRMKFKRSLKRAKANFEKDVAAGKRSDNPVNLPLYPYQKTGMMHLAFTGRALLADEMGLGKTVQAIAAAQLLQQLRRVRRVLVVCPTSLKAEWEDQLMQFTGRQAKLLYGLRPQRLQVYAEDHDFLVANYEQIRNDVDEINRLFAPDLVILDEAQRIKNWPTKTAKTIKRLDSPYAFVLTGTPLENRIEELYSLVEFIDPHILGSVEKFQRSFMNMDADGKVEPANLGDLHRTVAPIMLRRRKADVEDNLPERTDKHFYVPMTAEQRTRYDEFAYEVAKLLQVLHRRPLRPEERERLMVLLGCMRMTCDTPYILDPECRDCPKLDELESILDELLTEPACKIIIFSEWVRMLDLVMELLDEKGIGYTEHTGRVPQKRRRENIRVFKEDPHCRIFLSSESGGAGLNLQVADTVINLDLPWNPAKLEQRIARAWRKHQERPVRVLNLIAEDCIESAMVDKLAYKTALANAVLDGAKAPGKKESTQAFTDRLSELMGLKEDEEPPAPATPSDLPARFPDQVLGIESHPASGRSLLIARTAEDAERIRKQGAPAEMDVLDAATWQLLQKLAGQGLVSLSPELENTFASDGYQPPPAPAPIKKMHLRKARAYWEKQSGELRAARTLLDLNLVEQAAPHLVAVLESAAITLAICHAAHPRQTAEQVPASKCGAQEQLVSAIQAWLAEAPHPDTGIELLDQVENVLNNTP